MSSYTTSNNGLRELYLASTHISCQAHSHTPLWAGAMLQWATSSLFFLSSPPGVDAHFLHNPQVCGTARRAVRVTWPWAVGCGNPRRAGTIPTKVRADTSLHILMRCFSALCRGRVVSHNRGSTMPKNLSSGSCSGSSRPLSAPGRITKLSSARIHNLSIPDPASS